VLKIPSLKRKEILWCQNGIMPAQGPDRICACPCTAWETLAPLLDMALKLELQDHASEFIIHIMGFHCVGIRGLRVNPGSDGRHGQSGVRVMGASGMQGLRASERGAHQYFSVREAPSGTADGRGLGDGCC
jgi:hypothetical protein